MKTETRKMAEQIQAKTGQSLVTIHWYANQYLEAGLCETTIEALTYMAELEGAK